jgi:flavin reductase (DIM6/NTAB) family NADH-FMN oxidoreductase RutF
MTISWTMVLDFTPRFAITTGAWNHSYAALTRTKQCVLAIPAIDLLDTAVGIGTCSGADTDKFEKFGLARAKASRVRAPLLPGCVANIECRVVDIVAAHDIVVLDALAAWHDPARNEQRRIHAVGDGTFVQDGRHFDRRAAMRAKLPAGI